LLAPGIALHVLGREPRLLRRAGWLGAAALAVAAGLLPFLYLPIRSAMDPLLDWGNPESWQNFWYMVRRSQFAGIEAGADVTLGGRLMHLRDVAVRLAFVELTPLCVPLAAMGVYRLFQRHRLWACSTAVMAGASIIGPIVLLDFPYEPSRVFVLRVYLIQAVVLVALWAAVGLDSLAARLAQGRPSLRVVASLILPAAVAGAHFDANDLRGDDLARRHASAILATLPRDAILLGVRDDADLFPLLYAKAVEGERPDVTVIDDFGLVFNRWRGRPLADRVVRRRAELMAYRERAVALAQASGRPVFYIHAPEGTRHEVEPFGILCRRAPAGQPPDFDALYGDILRLTPADVPNYMARFVAGKYHLRHGLALASAGRAPDASGAFDRARAFARGHVELLVLLNRELNRAGEFERAADCLNEVVALALSRENRLRIDHHFSRMEHHEARRDADALVGELRAVRAIDPGHAEARARLAQALFDRGRGRGRAGRCAEALPDLLEARALGSDAGWTGSLIGVCLVQGGRVDEGLEELRRAVAARPDEPAIRGNLAAMLARTGRTAK
jgi:tetratricopeptide (TPR) repeat protein